MENPYQIKKREKKAKVVIANSYPEPGESSIFLKQMIESYFYIKLAKVKGNLQTLLNFYLFELLFDFKKNNKSSSSYCYLWTCCLIINCNRGKTNPQNFCLWSQLGDNIIKNSSVRLVMLMHVTSILWRSLLINSMCCMDN